LPVTSQNLAQRQTTSDRIGIGIVLHQNRDAFCSGKVLTDLIEDPLCPRQTDVPAQVGFSSSGSETQWAMD